jgi:hypothetical protein
MSHRDKYILSLCRVKKIGILKQFLTDGNYASFSHLASILGSYTEEQGGISKEDSDKLLRTTLPSDRLN